MIPLTYEQNRFHKKQKVCDICKKEFNTDKNDKNQTKLHHKKEIIVTILESTEELLTIFELQNTN